MNYASLGAKAYKLIVQYGKPVTLIRGAGRSVPDAQGNRSGSSLPVSGFAVETASSEAPAVGAGARERVRKLLLAGTPAPVVVQDKLTFAGSTWAITKSEPIAPGPTDIVYEIEVRG